MMGRRFIAGDALRGVSACTVMVGHVLDVSLGSSAPWWHVAEQTALLVFFVLSGYLIAWPFVASLLRRAPLPSASGYFVNRALRIVPAFWAVAGVVAVVTVFAYPGRLDVWSVVTVFAFAQNYWPSDFGGEIDTAWTLGVEASFYLAVPLLAAAAVTMLRAASFSVRRWALVGFLVVSWSASWAVFEGTLGDPGGLNVSLLAMWWPFVPGIALAYLDITGGLSRAPVLLAAAPVLAAGALLTQDAARELSTFLMAAAASVVVGGALARERHTGRSWELLERRTLAWLGDHSYGIYLIHLPVAFAVWAALRRVGLEGWGPPTAVVVVVVSTFIAAMWLRRWVEVPFLRLRRVYARPGLRQRVEIVGGHERVVKAEPEARRVGEGRLGPKPDVGHEAVGVEVEAQDVELLRVAARGGNVDLR